MLKNLLLLSGFSAFAVTIIIAFNIYHNFTLSSLPASTLKRVVEIPPTFDKDTLDELQKRMPATVNLSEKTKVISEDSQNTLTLPTPSISETQDAASNSGTPL